MRDKAGARRVSLEDDRFHGKKSRGTRENVPILQARPGLFRRLSKVSLSEVGPGDKTKTQAKHYSDRRALLVA